MIGAIDEAKEKAKSPGVPDAATKSKIEPRTGPEPSSSEVPHVSSAPSP